MPAFSPGCQQSPPIIRGIKGETSSDMTNNKSTGSSLLSRQSLGSSCLSSSCTLMSRGGGLALCLRGSSGERWNLPLSGFYRKAALLPGSENLHEIQHGWPEPKDGEWWWWLGSCRDAGSPSDQIPLPPCFPPWCFPSCWGVNLECKMN